MTIAYDSAGTVGVGSTSVTPGALATMADGDLIVIISVTKPNTATFTLPSNWTLEGSSNGGAGSNGVDTGPTKIHVISRIKDSGWSSLPTISITNGNSSASMAFRFTKTTGSWTVLNKNGTYNTGSAGLSFDVTTSALDLAVGDLIFTALSNQTDNANVTLQSYTSSGITFSSINAVTEAIETSTGNDVGGMMWLATVTAGTGNVTVRQQATFVGLSTGACVMIRLHELIQTYDLAATGSGSTTGTATIAATASLSASGSGSTAGTATIAATADLAASGSGATAGTAALLLTADIAAAAIAQTAGTADIGTIVDAGGAGTSQTSGSAAIDIESGATTHELAADGASQTSGDAAIATTHGLTASGSTSTIGTATTTGTLSIGAIGTASTSGSAAITRTARLSASASRQTSGSAILTATRALSASGAAALAGEAAIRTLLALTAAADAQTSGSAAIFSYTPRDITVTATIAPPRWVASLPPGRTAVLAPARSIAAAVLPGRTATLAPARRTARIEDT